MHDKVQAIVDRTPIIDIHTHLYDPALGLTLWGVDEILTYHYLVAEVMRVAPITPTQFWAMSKKQQADLIWDYLFVRNSPLSEATSGVVTIFQAFGLDPRAKDLTAARRFFAERTFEEHVTDVFRLAGIESVVMTNDPLDEREAPQWTAGFGRDPRFHAVLRLDRVLQMPAVEVRKTMEQWIAKMRPLYCAVSLPPTFKYRETDSVFSEAVLPVCREHNLPFAMMIGVRKQVNPELGDAGDSVGYTNLAAVERLCHGWPDVKFLVTVLARENQHALCVAARKFANLLPFGCWWFMNNPSLVEETTRMRLEMLGTSFVPQHSDARVLEQVIYKWKHSRRAIANALTGRYEALARSGWSPSDQEIERDARLLLRDNVANWLGIA